MPAPLILARTFKDAHTYAKDELGLKIGHYRVVNAPGTLKAVRNTTLHLVPGWDKRPDRFGMRAAMRYGRNEIVDVAALRAEEPAEQPVVDPTPEGTDFFDAVIASEESEPLPEPTCVDCGLTPCDDECKSAVAAEAAAQVAQDDEPEPAASPAEVFEGAQVTVPGILPEKPKKAKRRTRCKKCGSLHFKDEACPPSEDA